MKKIAILGSTGSIGKNALKVVESLPNQLEIVGLAANSSIDLIEKQTRKFLPKKVALADVESAKKLKMRLKELDVEVISGQEGILQIATMPEVEMVLPAIIGSAGMVPTLEAIKAGKDIAFVNKETLVMGGKLVMRAVKKNDVNFIPVDGEMNAIFQCLQNNSNKDEVERLILTASGGPFRQVPASKLSDVTPQEALNHPNWDMGKKITIDSATMMNKGFELIEASWLFDTKVSDIDIIIHLESIVHSLVEFIDGSVLAQLAVADMRIPIQYALTYPKRINSSLKPLNLTEIGSLNFEEVDLDKFPCLRLAYKAAQVGGTMPTVLSSADEVAVQAFLDEKIRFTDIPVVIESVMDKYKKEQSEVLFLSNPTIKDILSAIKWTKNETMELIKKKRKL